jgi:hypothetical protein
VITEILWGILTIVEDASAHYIQLKLFLCCLYEICGREIGTGAGFA